MSGTNAAYLGLDFGTTNTVATTLDSSGALEAFVFQHERDAFNAFRSVLCFWKEEDAAVRRHCVAAGPWAIDQFLELEGDCRFIQSFKTFAASPLFTETNIFGASYAFEDLLASFLKQVRHQAGRSFPGGVVVGRPVRFAGLQPDEQLARTRYEAALKAVGFEDIIHVYEPVAAAYFFAQRLTQAATILVADFGGGTSDFSIVRFEPSGSGRRFTPLAQAGVGIAGDAFDFRIVDNLVSPRLGKGSFYRSWDKVLPLPNAYYSKFARWSQLSIMKHTRDFAELKRLARVSLEPEKLEAFIAFLEADAGYALNRAVTQVKLDLSRVQETRLRLKAPGVDLDAPVKRAAFEGWIADDLAQIARALDEALAQADLDAEEVDKVFLTGGTSFVPAVQNLFRSRFAPERIESGDQLVSIAYGLALIAGSNEPEKWAA